MTHVVLNEKQKCPKCFEEHMGSAQALYDFVVCVQCFELFEKELHPELKKQVLEYFSA